MNITNGRSVSTISATFHREEEREREMVTSKTINSIFSFRDQMKLD